MITYLARDVDLGNQDFDRLQEVVEPEEIRKLGISYNKCKMNNQSLNQLSIYSLLVL
jgi:hypothetical protein